MNEHKNNQSGQALLIMILVAVVGLTVAITTGFRGSTNVKLSSEEQESQRALAAAEAGIEKALRVPTPVAIAERLSNESFIKQVQITPVDGYEVLVNGGNIVNQDDGADIWLTKYDDGIGSPPPDYAAANAGNPPFAPSNFAIYWGDPLENCSVAGQEPAAIEVIVINGPLGSSTASRFVYDPCGRPNNLNTNVDTTASSYTILGRTFKYRTKTSGVDSIVITNGIIARVIPLYKSTKMAISTCAPAGCGGAPVADRLPSQGQIIESVGQAGGTQRKLSVFQAFPKLPSEFFQYVLFSP